MIKRLTKQGNSWSLLLEKPILKLLNIDEKTDISLEIQDGALIIRPAGTKNNISEDAKMQKLYEKLVKEYGPALKKLALIDEAADKIMDTYEKAFKKLAE